MRILDYQNYKDCPKEISTDLLNEEWAWNMHKQTLTELNRRGGMSPYEIYLNVNRLDVPTETSEKEALEWLLNFLKFDKAILDAC